MFANGFRDVSSVTVAIVDAGTAFGETLESIAVGLFGVGGKFYCYIVVGVSKSSNNLSVSAGISANGFRNVPSISVIIVNVGTFLGGK